MNADRATPDACDAFLDENGARLFAFLVHFTADRHEAEDVYQETCIRIVREWPRVRAHARPFAWAVRVARNLATNRHRRRSAEDRVLRANPDLSAPGEPSDEHAMRDELCHLVTGALARLDTKQRNAVCLRIWGGLTWTEIAECLDTSADTAARLFARGLRTLRPALEGLTR